MRTGKEGKPLNSKSGTRLALEALKNAKLLFLLEINGAVDGARS